MADDEHGGRGTYTRGNARSGGGQPSSKRSIARGAQDRYTLALQRPFFGGRRRLAAARVRGFEPTGKLNARVLDGLDDDQPCGARIAERIVVLVADAEIAAEDVQTVAGEMG